ncbi:MAG: CPBP family intramembrane metalloprotease [Candidatus Aminicenantes bacterium]|nr:MAG: CPBP family intramembrane metalloprotease [Candidatus Aminicenantes bacterium]
MPDFEEKTAHKSFHRNPWTELTILVFIFFISGILLWLGNKSGSALLTLLSILLALGLIRSVLWLRRSSWREFGLKKPKSWLKTILLACGGLITIYIVLIITMPIVIRLTGKPVDRSQFDALRGNVPALIFGLLIVWTLAAFGEELIFRGYLMNTLARVLGNRNGAWIFACFINSILFGIGHTYQGISGVILLGIVGLLYAFFYLGSGRNLWVPILIHGLYDTSAFLVIFFNLDKSST